MNTRRSTFGFFKVLFALALVMLAFSACSHEHEAVVVSLITAPSTVTAGQSVSLIASVGNDASEAGVDWSCAGGSCGTFAPAHTASGAPTTFTAPAEAGTLTVVATSSADAAAQDSLDVSVVPAGSNGLLSGTYVFSVLGQNETGTYTAAGTIVADGAGLITAGEQDYADSSRQAGPDPLTGAYAIGPDGRGSITLTVNNADLPQGGLETFSVVVLSSGHALLIEFDGTATSSGGLDRQSASALDPSAIDGPFAFTSQGEDISIGLPIARGGVLSLSAAAGTVASGTYFENDAGVTQSSAVTGTVTAPDSFGRGTLDLTTGLSYVYYAVQGRVLRILEASSPSYVTAGSLYGQGQAGFAGTFSNASLAGDYVLAGAGATAYGSLALAGQFAADGAGNFSAGHADLNNAGVATSASIAGQARYAVTGVGVGTLELPASVDQLASVASLRFFLVDPGIDLADPNNPAGGGGALFMDFDSLAVSSGRIVPQSAGSLDGEYAVGFRFVSSAGATHVLGRAGAADGVLTGPIDINANGVIDGNAALTDAFSADAANPGRSTGTLTVGGATHMIVFYVASGSRIVFVDVDGGAVGIGILERPTLP
jgi:hypothetical protein